MADFPAFIEFPKLARLSRDMVVTEKIDGTNASILIRELSEGELWPSDTPFVAVRDRLVLYAGSRTRYITPEQDNYGFARWVRDNAEQLALLGVGHHFGEWWGSGIQRRYGLAEKRFSLFNTGRWSSNANNNPELGTSTQCIDVPVCHVVPVLARATFDTTLVDACLLTLSQRGSFAAPGFDKPEGVVVYHTKADVLFKKTLDHNDDHKGA